MTVVDWNSPVGLAIFFVACSVTVVLTALGLKLLSHATSTFTDLIQKKR